MQQHPTRGRQKKRLSVQRACSIAGIKHSAVLTRCARLVATNYIDSTNFIVVYYLFYTTSL